MRSWQPLVMHLWLTLSDGHRIEHIAVDGPAGVPWAAVAARLPSSWPLDPAAYVVACPGGPVVLGPTSPVGEPPLLHGAGLLVGATTRSPARGHRRSTPAPAEMVVVEGPDCGHSWALSAGDHVSVGRDPSCRASIQDPALSRRHCTVTATRQGVRITDLGSTNGARLDGHLVLGGASWSPGQRLSIGASVLELDVASLLPLHAERDGAGSLVVTPTTRRVSQPTEVQLRSPPAPEIARPTAPPVLAWALPLLVSVGLALVLRMPMLLLFGLMAPAMMLGSHLGERRQRRTEHRRACARHTEDLAASRQQALRAVADELSLLRSAHPDLARWGACVRDRPREPLWAQVADAEGLVLRFGRARRATSVHVDGVAVPADGAPLLHRWTGTLGIVGPPSTVRALARALICQAALAHDPRTLALECAAPDPEWDWIRWAARHRRSGSAIRVLIDDRLERPGDTAPATGTVVLRLARSPEELGAVDDLVEVVDQESARWHASGLREPIPFGPDLLSRDVARWMLRRVAGWCTPERSDEALVGVVPRSVALTDLHPGADDPSTIQRGWQARPRSTRFLLGVGPTGPVEVDLAVDGPHALVAGTTGSGKSELLRTLVTGLALGNRPDELLFVLVDYKGGAAFAECAQLPHCVGLVTDLDQHLADRALTSLGAELKRRERLLADAAARDLTAYQALPGMPALPRLVIVIDEYRALAEELPAFVDGLVRIAALGRSLGLHLVLATQRPTGIVSADVRANMNLRIALRLRDAADSYDVLEAPDAAALPEGLPGRALLRTGADAPRTVQVARVADAFSDEESAVQVRRLESLWPDQGRQPARESQARDDGGELATRIAEAAGQAASALGATSPPSPWLAPLPPVLALAGLTDPDDASAPRDPGAAGPQAPEPAVAWGLLDLPQQQRQEPVRWDPVADGNLAVIGAPRAGRSTTLRTVCSELLRTQDAGRVHIYVFDGSGGLQVLGDAPHTGALVTAEEPARAARVLQRLLDTLARRQRDLAAAGLTSFDEHRGTANPWPLIVWVVDGWGRLAQAQAEHARGAGLEAAHRLLGEGPGVGIVALIAGDRSLLSGRTAASLPTVWALRLTDPTDLMMAGLRREQIPAGMPPGRVIRLRDAMVAQVAVIGDDPTGSVQVTQVPALLQRTQGRDAAVPDGRRPWRVSALPITCRWSELDGGPLLSGPILGGSPGRTSPGGHDALLIGVGGDEACPLGLPLDLTAGGGAVVVGAPGTGRSTALRTLAQAARSQGRAVVAVDGSSADPTALRLQLESDPRPLVTVDDVERLADTPVEDVLLSWADSLSTRGGALVVASDSERAGTAYRGLVPIAARDRTGLILCPQAAGDGSVLGVSAPIGGLLVPGRGVLVHRGSAKPVQVALPSD